MIETLPIVHCEQKGNNDCIYAVINMLCEYFNNERPFLMDESITEDVPGDINKLAELHNIRFEKLDLSDENLRHALKLGFPILIDANNSSHDGHALLIAGYDETGKYLVMDPASSGPAWTSVSNTLTVNGYAYNVIEVFLCRSLI